jgi:hypothetical protein
MIQDFVAPNLRTRDSITRVFCFFLKNLYSTGTSFSKCQHVQSRGAAGFAADFDVLGSPWTAGTEIGAR